MGEKEVKFLLYADDLIVVCKSGKDLQTCIDRLERYIETWNLSVNVDQSKVLVFTKTSKYMRIKAQKALFSLTRSLIYKPMPISTMLEIFDKTIMPILLYGSDVWDTLSFKSENIYSGNQILVPEKADLSLEVEKLKCFISFHLILFTHGTLSDI